MDPAWDVLYVGRMVRAMVAGRCSLKEHQMSNIVSMPRDDFHATDGEIDGTEREVWGLPMMATGSGRGHLFVREHDGWKALCGVTAPLRIWNGQNGLFRVGSYPKCRRCMDLVRKR